MKKASRQTFKKFISKKEFFHGSHTLELRRKNYTDLLESKLRVINILVCIEPFQTRKILEILFYAIRFEIYKKIKMDNIIMIFLSRKSFFPIT